MADIPLSFLNDRIANVDSANTVLSSLRDANGKALLDMLSGLSNGETILCKVLSVEEDSYTIQTNDGAVINAKTEGSVALKAGSSVLFEVNKSADSSVSLRPLNLNTSNAETAKSALTAAGIPINSRSLEMTERLMEYSMPIDRNSLIASYKDVFEALDVPVRYIVDLQRMDIPRTGSNISGYGNYLNMENLLTEGFSNIGKELVDSWFSELSQNPTAKEINGLLDSFFESVPKDSEGDGFAVFIKNLVSDLKGTVNESIDSLMNDKNRAPGTMSPETPAKGSFGETFNTGFDVLGEEDAPLPKGEEILRSDVLETLKERFLDMTQRALSQRLALNPGEAASKREVKDLYERLFSDSKKMLSLIGETVPKQSPVAVSITNFSANLDFMNALNSFIPYIQIPFKSENGANSGELYVFRNKRGITEKGGEISAFLHLDMESLGPTDVYIKMKNDHVSTNFCLADEESLDFIERNISFLSKRLNEKGYGFSYESSVSDNKKTPIEKMLDVAASKVCVAKTSFDARI